METRLNYLKQCAGFLNVLEMACTICILICVAVGDKDKVIDGIVIFAASGALICTVFNITVNVFVCIEMCSTKGWVILRLLSNGFWALWFFVSIWLCVSQTNAKTTRAKSSYAAASVFCGLAFLAEAVDFYIYWKRLRFIRTVVHETTITSEIHQQRRY